jgi:predicted Holliday junction resolvase-like endonuclease
MNCVDARKQKIRELKGQIKVENDKLAEIIGELDVKKELELSEEEQKKHKEEWKTKTEVKRVEISNLREALKQTRMNKTGSPHFEFIPTMLNRQQRRLYRKMKRV